MLFIQVVALPVSLKCKPPLPIGALMSTTGILKNIGGGRFLAVTITVPMSEAGLRLYETGL